jgi:PAS domain S-box-containing protein
MSHRFAPNRRGDSRDRRRLLVFSTTILGTVALLSAAVTAFQLGTQSSGDADSWRRAVQLAIAETLVLVIAGGALLVRVVNPFVRRLEESEAQVRAIVATAADGILALDRQGTIQSFNLAAERLFARSAAAMAGRNIDELVLLASGRSFARELACRESPANGKAVGRAPGRTFPIELSISRATSTGPGLWTMIVRDTTEREAVQQQLRRQLGKLEKVKQSLEAKADELARANRELDDFTYLAAHDLKEPLRGISAYCQTLLDDYGRQLDADGERRLKAMIGLCQRLSHLVDDVLAYAQLAGRPPEVASTDLNQVVADVLSTLAPAIEQRGAQVRVSGVLPKLPADRAGVGEVLRNLISNALKFNDSVCPRVEIGSRGATIYVRDNGIGIARCHHEAIFAMFRRLHGRGKYEGTGAGLPLVRKIVEAHGGRVWLDSHPGHGSTFYFTLGERADAVEESAAGTASQAKPRCPG